MALKFIFGGSGSGKSHYLYERIIQEAGENPGLSYLVLVPEQFTMQTQKDLVMMSCEGDYEYRTSSASCAWLTESLKRQAKGLSCAG